ncbi:glycoside hydrolase family 3 C-terminal domain-containing protein [Lachnospiraceae bacterium ZAX-1]
MKKIEELLDEMTLDEKIGLLSGKDFWQSQDYEKYGISSLAMADGPCGLRKQEEEEDHLGIHKSVEATAFVSGPLIAASWDRNLAELLGATLGEEASSMGISLLLGPAVNIQRSPLCGRNFEYYSEDPYLTGDIAYACVNGIQKQGVGACIKHFAANNQETEREYINEIIDERTLREIYLTAFEKAIKEAKPWAVMTALNKVNGDFGAEHKGLLVDLLRDEWGYEGITISDWFGIDNRAKALAAGLDLEMPTSCGIGAKRINAGLQSGILSEHDIQKACRRILRCIVKDDKVRRPQGGFDQEKHHRIARKAAEEGSVLLKNERNILPLERGDKITVIGEYAMKARFQMEGSAKVIPTMVDQPLDCIRDISAEPVCYAKGYSTGVADEQELLIQEAVKAAQISEKAIVFLAIPEGVESEGHDRKNIALPSNQVRLLEQVLQVQKNVIVILFNGAPIEMPWIDRVPAVMECFLGGQAIGSAIAKLLYGKSNPSGKLPVSFPVKLEDTPCYFDFPGDKETVNYSEGVFVGYRYYEKRAVETLFAFGHGLSYTTFDYSKMKVQNKEGDLIAQYLDNQEIAIEVLIKNSGMRAGAEVVQLYVGMFDSSVKKPVKELKGFEKIWLEPGEEGKVVFILNKRSFAYYRTEINDWYTDPGEYKIMIGSSSTDIRLADSLNVSPEKIIPKRLTGWSTIGDLRSFPKGRELFEQWKEVVLEHSVMEEITQCFKRDENDEELNKIALRFLTLATNSIIDYDAMKSGLEQCNRERFGL